MSDFSVNVTLSDEARVLVGRMTPRAITQATAEGLDYQNEITVGHIQLKKLSQRGPDTLGVQTNRLRASLNPAKAKINGTNVVSAIGSNVKYAGVHEFGFRGSVSVRPHTRRMTHLFGTPILTPITVSIGQHTRRMVMPERAPIRTGIVEKESEYSESITAAIVRNFDGGDTLSFGSAPTRQPVPAR